MKLFSFLFVLFLVAVSAITFSHLYFSEPIYIEYAGWSAAPPLSLAIGIVLTALLGSVLLLWIVLWILFFPARIRAWRLLKKSKQRTKHLSDILKYWAYQDDKKLLKSLEKISENDSLTSFIASQTAEKLGETTTHQRLLKSATTGDDFIVAAAAKAKLCARENRLTEANTILENAGAPKSSILLAQIYYAINDSRKDYDRSLKAAIALRETNTISWREITHKTFQQKFESIQSVDEIESFWKDAVPAEDKKSPDIVATYISTLWRLGSEKQASEVLTRSMKSFPQNNKILEVVAAYGNTDQCLTAIKSNENRALKASANDKPILTILANLSMRLDLWGKAKNYYQMLNRIAPSPHYQQILLELSKKSKEG